MNKFVYGALVGIAGLSLVALSGCGAKKEVEVPAQEKPLANLTAAKRSAQSALDFMYKGDTSGLSDFTTNTADDIKQLIVKPLEDKQNEAFTANGNGNGNGNGDANDYFLVLDGSKYMSTEIVKGYADAYYNQIKTVGSAKITDVQLGDNGEKATVTATFKPIAALSEAHPIGEARTEAFGGLDNDTIIRTSQNKDIKTINKLITLKLYSVYYGDMGKIADKGSDDVTVKFSMTKSGNHYDVNTENLLTIAKVSRANVYASNDSSNPDYSGSSESEQA